MSKTVITNRQFTVLMSGYMFGAAPLLISSSVTALAGPDAWLSAIFATIFGLLIVWLNSILGGLHPEKTLIEILQTVLGKWIGNLAALLFVFITFITATQIVWYVGDFFTTSYLVGLPNYHVNVMFISVLTIALLYDLEAMFRAAEIFFLVGFPMTVLTMVLLFPQMKIENLLPIMEKGIVPAIKGTVPILNFCVLPLVFLNMIFPSNMGNIKKAKKSMFAGYFLGIMTMSISVMVCILVLGSTVTQNLRFPLFTVTKEINVGSTFSRVEGVMVFAWLVTNFITTYIFLYTSVKGLSQILKLRDHKIIVLPLCLIMAVYSGFIYTNVPYEIKWDTVTWTSVGFTFGLFIPSALLIVSLIRRKLGNRK